MFGGAEAGHVAEIAGSTKIVVIGFTGEYDEAIRLSREALRERSDFVGTHRVLTAAIRVSGRRDMAKAALSELRRVQPDVSLSWIKNTMPFEKELQCDAYVEGFRRAGTT